MHESPQGSQWQVPENKIQKVQSVRRAPLMRSYERTHTHTQTANKKRHRSE